MRALFTRTTTNYIPTLHILIRFPNPQQASKKEKNKKKKNKTQIQKHKLINKQDKH